MNDRLAPDVIDLSQRWRLGEEFRAGGFGRVYLAQSEDDEAAVVKLIPKYPGADRELLFEELSGTPNVVPILDTGEWDNFWVLVMPRAEKSLRDYLDEAGGRLTVDNAIPVLVDVVEALAAIEGRVVHRDIKPDNILLLNRKWSLADFGISRYAEATTALDTRKYSMTPAYAAPEQWRGEQATSATDVYAVGVVAHQFLAGRLPFPGPEIHDYRQQHLAAKPEPIRGVPVKLESLVIECLYKSPDARPRPQNLLTRLREELQPASEAGRRLQQANALAVQQQAEASRQQSVAKSRAERRLALCNAADESLERLWRLLHDRIMADAPTSGFRQEASLYSWSLMNARLIMDKPKMAEAQSGEAYDPPFEIVAHSSIAVGSVPHRDGYKGRSHSLWYCDAQERGVFRWYETAFMHMFSTTSLRPFALNPGRDAYEALSRAVAVSQVAWPFTPFDQGAEDDFIERWIGWFAEATEGKLHRPQRMPERDPHGSWRQDK